MLSRRNEMQIMMMCACFCMQGRFACGLPPRV